MEAIFGVESIHLGVNIRLAFNIFRIMNRILSQISKCESGKVVRALDEKLEFNREYVRKYWPRVIRSETRHTNLGLPAGSQA